MYTQCYHQSEDNLQREMKSKLDPFHQQIEEIISMQSTRVQQLEEKMARNPQSGSMSQHTKQQSSQEAKHSTPQQFYSIEEQKSEPIAHQTMTIVQQKTPDRSQQSKDNFLREMKAKLDSFQQKFEEIISMQSMRIQQLEEKVARNPQSDSTSQHIKQQSSQEAEHGTPQQLYSIEEQKNEPTDHQTMK